MKHAHWILPLTALCAIPIAPAWSAGHQVPVMVELVNDDELANMRGKYLGQFVVTGFMVDMATQWLNRDAIATANARIAATGLDRPGVPDVSIRTSATVNTASNASNGMAESALRNIHIDGLGQISQIAGDGNSMSNITSISMQREPLQNGGGTTPGSPASQASGGGYTAHASIAGNTLNIGISTPNGIAEQGVHSRGSGAAGSLMQTAQIVGNQQHVINQMSVQLQIRSPSAAQLGQISMGHALEAVSMLRR